MKLIQSLNFNQLINKFKNNGIRPKNLCEYIDSGKNWRTWLENEEEYKIFEKLEALGEKFQLVHEEGGTEGSGSNHIRVIYFPYHNVFIEMRGFYQSYNGTSWDYTEFKEVKPKQVQRVEFLPPEKEVNNEDVESFLKEKNIKNYKA